MPAIWRKRRSVFCEGCWFVCGGGRLSQTVSRSVDRSTACPIHPSTLPPKSLKLTRTRVLHVGQGQHLEALARVELGEEPLAPPPALHVLGPQRPHPPLQFPVQLPGVLAGQRRAHQLIGCVV